MVSQRIQTILLPVSDHSGLTHTLTCVPAPPEKEGQDSAERVFVKLFAMFRARHVGAQARETFARAANSLPTRLRLQPRPVQDLFPPILRTSLRKLIDHGPP